MHPIRQFEHYAGWRDQGEAPPGSAEEELAKAEAWLDKYEPALKWDQKKQRFNGAPPPGLENLAASAEAVARRYGLKLGDASGGGLDEVRRLFSELIELLERNPEAGKDAQLGELILALVGPGRLEQDQLLRERLLVKLPKLHRAAGVKVWAECIRRALVQASAVPGGYSSFPSELTSQRLRGLDRSILPEASQALGAEFTARYAASAEKKAEERLPLALACLYAGGKVEMAEIERLLAEAGKIGTPRISLRSWAEGLVDAGNPAGLRVLLLSAGSFPQSRAHDLAGFEYLAGRSQDRFGGRMFELDEKALLARIEAARKWLDDNQKNLVFDPDKGRFRLKTAQNPDPAKPPAEEVF